EIACSVAQHRQARPAERRHYQLATNTFINRVSGFRIYHFKDKLQLVQMNEAGLSLTVKSPRAHFRCACVVKTGSPPKLLDTSLYVGDACAGFARVNCSANRGRTQIQPQRVSDLGQMKRIGWSAD